MMCQTFQDEFKGTGNMNYTHKECHSKGTKLILFVKMIALLTPADTVTMWRLSNTGHGIRVLRCSTKPKNGEMILAGSQIWETWIFVTSFFRSMAVQSHFQLQRPQNPLRVCRPAGNCNFGTFQHPPIIAFSMQPANLSEILLLFLNS